MPTLVETPTPVAVVPTDVSSASEAVSSVTAASAIETVESPPLVRQPALPNHAQLIFNVYKGTNLKVGEARQELDINADKTYSLQSGMETTGIARVFKTFVISQQSTGIVDVQGLRPDKFSEIRHTSRGNKDMLAQFDWVNKQLIFAGDNHVALPVTAQDILSFLYQFSQIPLNQATLRIYVSNGNKLESYQVEVGDEESIRTPMGTLRALPLRKVHGNGEEGLEIWLGLEYRLLPVKIVQIDRRGEIAGEMDIVKISVSDE
jgi:hypothetical protein